MAGRLCTTIIQVTDELVNSLLQDAIMFSGAMLCCMLCHLMSAYADLLCWCQNTVMTVSCHSDSVLLCVLCRIAAYSWHHSVSALQQ